MSHSQVRSNVFEIKKGDTSPALSTVLRAEGVPFDLTDVVGVLFTMKLCKHPYTVQVDHENATFVADDTGQVSYEWADGDTDIQGTYDAEWTVVYPLGITTTVPSSGFDQVVVTPSLS